MPKLILPDKIALDKTDLEVKKLSMKSQEIIIIVQIYVHAFKGIVRKRCFLIDGRFVLLFDWICIVELFYC